MIVTSERSADNVDEGEQGAHDHGELVPLPSFRRRSISSGSTGSAMSDGNRIGEAGARVSSAGATAVVGLAPGSMLVRALSFSSRQPSDMSDVNFALAKAQITSGEVRCTPGGSRTAFLMNVYS